MRSFSYVRFATSAALFVGATACSDGASSDAASSTTATTGSTSSTSGSGGLAAGACNSRLVPIQTGPDASCEGGGVHYYPLDNAADDCHGWRAVDPNGKVHDNSVDRIQCEADGSFSFYQYGDSIDCTEKVGPAVKKVFHAGQCEQDIPPTLYSIPADALACCVNPDSAECKSGFPTVAQPNPEIYLNGELCSE